ncbi:MAG TPA: hypothetical protein VK738_09955 [Terriglobales bacterium]|jgi:hypothetical protein|nr:hypothetical protein [Terriglobales bacterium]
MNPEEPKDAAEHLLDDRWLDEALAHYSAAEPRAGLETRIVANLQAHAARRQRRWIYGFAAAAAAVLFAVAMVNVRSPKPEAPKNLATKTPPSEVELTGQANTVTNHPQQASVQHVQERRTMPTMQENRVGSEVNLQIAEVKPGDLLADESTSEQEGPPPIDPSETSRQEQESVVAEQQSAPESNLPALSIEAIEIKELAPFKKMD